MLSMVGFAFILTQISVCVLLDSIVIQSNLVLKMKPKHVCLSFLTKAVQFKDFPPLFS